MSVSLVAPQSNTTNGPLRRALCSWTARAASSLPVPLSPMNRIDAPPPLARSSIANTRRMAGLSPYSAPNADAVLGSIAIAISSGKSCNRLPPTRTMAPAGTVARVTATRSTNVPLREPRSVTSKPASVGTIVQCRRDTAASVSETSHAASAPTTTPIGGIEISAAAAPSTRNRHLRAPACSSTWLVTRLIVIVPTICASPSRGNRRTRPRVGEDPRAAGHRRAIATLRVARRLLLQRDPKENPHVHELEVVCSLDVVVRARRCRRRNRRLVPDRKLRDARCSSGVYFILVGIGAFLSTQRTQASAGGAIGAFLVTGIVAAIACFLLIGHLVHGAASSVTGADHATAEQAGAVVGTAVGAVVAVVAFVETLVAGIIGALIGAKSR